MIRFEDVVQIEAHRHEIEVLQEQLSLYGNLTKFGWLDGNDRWHAFSTDMTPVFREVACKCIALKIMGLLTKCKNLGVDTTDAEAKITAFLKQMAPAPDGERVFTKS
jgi:hypothetical protein